MNRIRDIPNEKYRSRDFCGIFYMESDDYDCGLIMQRIEDISESYAIIFHDCDTDDNGELKKPHFHYYLRRASAASYSATAKKLGLPLNHVEYCRNPKKMLRYFIHADNPEKYQYDSGLIESNIENINDILNPATEKQRVRALYNKIAVEKCKSPVELVKWSVDNDCWSEFRRGYQIWKDIMKEVN